MSVHNVNLTHPPHWVRYAGSVTVELENAFQEFQAGRAPAVHNTDLTDRISSTGTETKAHKPETGCEYRIDFANMKQINTKTDFARKVLRRKVDSPAASASVLSQHQIPGELEGEIFLQLKIGNIVQVSKQLPNNWAFGNIIYSDEEEWDTGSIAVSDHVSFDAGWFPMSCTEISTKAAFEKLHAKLGGAGIDCLATPSQWNDLSDKEVAQTFLLPEGGEKQKVVACFLATMTPATKVVKVERIQNLSLWQSYAVKRQIMDLRDADKTVADLERAWLFHGTNTETVPKIVQQGFNRTFAGTHATFYGKGVYFARDAAYSSGKTYAAPDAKGQQRMFMCRVLVGQFCQGKKDAPVPDVREDRDAAHHILYDSTVDDMTQPSIFVTYHDAQAYPEYLVTFSCGGQA